MTWVRSHRRSNGLFRRSSWVRSHRRRAPRRRLMPIVPIVIAVVVILILIALF
jgi:hypothetical protein